MVQITISKNSIEVTHHATGSPEVCHGISALMFTLEGWLANSGLEYKAEKTTLPLYRIECDDLEAKTAMDLVKIGLLQINKRYPLSTRIYGDPSAFF